MSCLIPFSKRSKRYKHRIADIDEDCHDYHGPQATHVISSEILEQTSINSIVDNTPESEIIQSVQTRSNSFSPIRSISSDLQMDLNENVNVSETIISTTAKDLKHFDISYVFSNDVIIFNILQFISVLTFSKLALVSTNFYKEIKAKYHFICKSQIERIIPTYHIHHSFSHRNLWNLYLMFDKLTIKNCHKSLFVVNDKHNFKINPFKWYVGHRHYMYYKSKDNLTVLDLDFSKQTNIVLDGKINLSHIPFNVDILRIVINDTTHQNMNVLLSYKDNNKCAQFKNKRFRIILPNNKLHIKGVRFMKNKIDFKHLHFNIVQYNNVKTKQNKNKHKIELILDGNKLCKILNINKLRSEMTNIKIINQELWNVNCKQLQFSHISNLIELNLSNNNIKGNICELPSLPKYLKHLNLSNNIDLFGIMDFKSKLFSNCRNNIKDIIIDGCSLSAIINYDFIPRTLTELKLRNNKIITNVEDILTYCDKYYSIKYIGLSNNKICGTFTFDASVWPHLISVIDLSQNEINANIDLYQWPDSLMALDLRGNQISEEDIVGSELIKQQPWKFDAFVYENELNDFIL